MTSPATHQSIATASRAPRSPHASAALASEGAALGRYVLDRPIGPELIDRYVTAHEHLDVGDSGNGDLAVVSFAIAHPAALPYLDAAAALVRPQALLHRKALLMTAILEASPLYADEFLPRSVGWLGLAWLGTRVAVATVFQVAIGLPLLLLLLRRA